MTDAARQLVSDLQAASSSWRWPGTPDPCIALLEKIGHTGDPWAIRHLLGPMLTDGAVGRNALCAIRDILEARSISELPKIEMEIRNRSWWREASDSSWRTADPNALQRHAPTAPEDPLVYHGVNSFHPSGYVREAAVQALMMESSGREVPFLLLRLNDWVAEVRQLAESALRARLAAEHVDAWSQALPLVVGLRERGRHRADDIIRSVLGQMTAPDHAAAFEAALTSPDRSVRRAAHGVARAAGGEVLARAAPFALEETDPMIRLELAKAVRAAGGADPDLEEKLLEDASMGVRREVLLGRIERAAPGVDQDLERAVVDRHRSIRQIARYFVAKRAHIKPDFAARYRAALAEAQQTSDTRTLRAALGGLAETGTAADALVASSLLTHPLPSVRAAAVRALLRLDGDGHAAEILAAADDASPRVARAVIEGLESDMDGVDAEAELASRIGQGALSVRAHRLRALAQLPYWRALPHLLRASADSDLHDRAVDALDAWVQRGSNRMFIAPSPDELANGYQALADADLPDALATEIEAQIRRWA